MNKSAVVTARIPDALLEQVDRLATRLDRQRAWIVQQAIARYVAQESAFLDFVQEGIDAADRGDVISQEEMEAWFAARGQRNAAE
jgi:predicted transcriptional regulator